MKALWFAGMWATLAVTVAWAQGPPCAAPTVFRIEEIEEKCVVPVVVRNKPTVREKVTVRDVPCTRQVPVCVTDDCGCPKTVYREEPTVKKVRTTILEIIPPAEECTHKTEEQTKRTFKIHFWVPPPAGGCPK